MHVKYAPCDLNSALNVPATAVKELDQSEICTAISETFSSDEKEMSTLVSESLVILFQISFDGVFEIT